MDYFDIHKFLDSLASYSSEGKEHYHHICSLIAYKMMNPDYPDQLKEFISIDYQSIRADKLEQLDI